MTGNLFENATPATVTRVIKGLSLTQPWASLVAHNEKRVETRSWGTSYRGLIAIHAAKGFPQDALDCCGEPHFRECLIRHGYRYPRDLPLGAIVAVAEIATIRYTGFAGVQPNWLSELSDQEKAFGDYTRQRYGWFLRNILRLPEPVPCKGALSLWDIPTDVRAALERQVCAVPANTQEG